jgi:hypothetical protein
VIAQVAGRLGIIPFELHSYGLPVVMSTSSGGAAD